MNGEQIFGPFFGMMLLTFVVWVVLNIVKHRFALYMLGAAALQHTFAVRIGYGHRKTSDISKISV